MMNFDGLINKGNINRIKNVMRRAQKGEDILISFLGGSITQGSLATASEKCYAYLVYTWWVNTFPQANVTYLNAGIGATDSRFAVARVRDHVLSKSPDFLLVEFAVNDEDDPFWQETYEGLVRTVLKCEYPIGLLLMNNAWFDSGKSAEGIHLPIARHYDVPMVSMKNTIYAAIENGELIKEDLSPDMLHPNDLGHRMVSDVIINSLEKIYAEVIGTDLDVAFDNDISFPSSITANRYEESMIINGDNFESFDVTLDGFEKDIRPKREFLDIFSRGFTAKEIGQSISLSVTCRGISVQFKRTVNKPAPVAFAIIDFDEKNPVMLDANFDEDWGDLLCLKALITEYEAKEHHIEIRINETAQNAREPFYLVSFVINV